MNNEQDSQKKEKMVRYSFWIIATSLVIIVIFVLSKVFGSKMTTNFPTGYKFIIEDHYAKDDSSWATYYVYDGYVLVKKDCEAKKNEPAMIYDGIDSSKLIYDEGDTTKICDIDSCYQYPKVLINIKKLISNKFGREYTGQ